MANDRRRRNNKRGPNGARSTEEIVRDRIASMLDHVRSARDIETLNATRAEFRKAVPFHLRAYVAAALLLDGAGALHSLPPRPNAGNAQPSGTPGKTKVLAKDEPRQKGIDVRFTSSTKADVEERTERQEGRRDQRREDRRDDRSNQGRDDRANQQRKQRAPAENAERRPSPVDEAAERKPRAEFKGEAATLFFGMGKRQHLYPRIVFKMLEGAGLDSAKVADVRSFDNYTFVSVDPVYSEQAIERLNGTEFRGRALTVGPARRKEESQEGEPSTADRATRSFDDEPGTRRSDLDDADLGTDGEDLDETRDALDETADDDFVDEKDDELASDDGYDDDTSDENDDDSYDDEEENDDEDDKDEDDSESV